MRAPGHADVVHSEGLNLTFFECRFRGLLAEIDYQPHAHVPQPGKAVCTRLGAAEEVFCNLAEIRETWPGRRLSPRGLGLGSNEGNGKETGK